MDQAQQLRNIIKAGPGQISQRPLARVITVTSGKGGVGKSNTAINLAVNFKKLGQRVIILDADFGLANIEIMFGTMPKHNLSDLIYQGKSITEIITWGPGEVGFISGGSGIAGLSNLGKEYLNYIIQNLAALDAIADVIIIDTGAGISDAVLEFLVASGEILLVTTPEPTSIKDSYSLLKALNRHPRFSMEDSGYCFEFCSGICNSRFSFSLRKSFYDRCTLRCSYWNRHRDSCPILKFSLDQTIL